jgi:hypothetical protein
LRTLQPGGNVQVNGLLAVAMPRSGSFALDVGATLRDVQA